MNWDEYFIEMAEFVAKKSKDPSTKVGSVLVDQKNSVISTGYNGFIAGCEESKMSWDRPRKYFTIIHAEMNSLLFAKRDLTGAKAYITIGPCENCLKHLLQAGVREIYYKDAGIMRDRSDPHQKDAIKSMIEATEAKVRNPITGKDYLEEIYETKSKV